MGFMRDDPRGFVVSLDLLIAIIPLTIMLGMVAADMGNIMFEIEDSVFRSSMDRVATDAVNTLLETSGDPNNWELSGSPNVVGLAKYDVVKNMPIEGTISSIKLGALNQGNVTNLIGSNYNFYINITQSSTGNTIYTLGSPPGNNISDVVRIEKVALYSKLEVVSSIIGEIRGSGAPRPYNNPPNPFNTSYYLTQNYDYWILVDSHGYNSTNITINTNTMYLGPNNISTPQQINSTFLATNASQPASFYTNNVTVMAGSNAGNWMDVYILMVPHFINPPITVNDINLANTKPQPCRFQFYLWAK